ncbi:MAG: hypothetical protein IAE94_06955 [Chthoniobacterales bacterium]|nr:hypothetical protein [Chthoniobacterales bacterium]
MKGKVAAFCRKYQEVLFWLGIGLALDVAFLMVKDAPLVADEGYHLPQISGFLSGNFEVSPHITVLPVYHAIMAGILKLIGAESVAEARLVTFLGSAASIWFFYLIVRRLWPEERYLRTAQFVFLPILFPMHFLIYTDTWALAFVLIALERGLAGRPWQSAAAITVAVLMRQPNLVWAGMIWILLVWKSDSLETTFEAIKSHWYRTTLPFVLVFAGFGGFILFNHGIAVGDRNQHEIGFNPANLWFFGLCFFIFFLPTCVGTLLRFWKPLRKNPIWAGAGFATGFSVFMATYHAAHQYNQASLWFYLRNRLLHWTSRIPAIKVLSFLPALIGLTSFVLGPLRERRFHVLIPVSLASIAVMPLIEQRYYLVAFSMFLAFRRLENRSMERINTAAYALCSYVLLEEIAQNKFFL